MAASNAGSIVSVSWQYSFVQTYNQAIAISGDLHDNRLMVGFRAVEVSSKLKLVFGIHFAGLWLCALLSFAPCYGLIIPHYQGGILLYSMKKWRKDIFEMALKIGMVGEASTLVVHENTAASVGAGGVEVFGTPMMVALMENAAWGAVSRDLDKGDVTVGTLVNVSHLAATPLGQQVRAIAELIEIDGRRLVFRVEAYDEKRKIGEGQHERYVVNLERFLKRLGE